MSVCAPAYRRTMARRGGIVTMMSNEIAIKEVEGDVTALGGVDKGTLVTQKLHTQVGVSLNSNQH